MHPGIFTAFKLRRKVPFVNIINSMCTSLLPSFNIDEWSTAPRAAIQKLFEDPQSFKTALSVYCQAWTYIQAREVANQACGVAEMDSEPTPVIPAPKPRYVCPDCGEIFAVQQGFAGHAKKHQKPARKLVKKRKRDEDNCDLPPPKRPTGNPNRPKTHKHSKVKLKDLVVSNIIPVNSQLFCNQKPGVVDKDGNIRYEGDIIKSASAWCRRNNVR